MDNDLSFWVGSWAGKWDAGHGTSEVTTEMDGRVVIERFQADKPDPFTGFSVSIKDRHGIWQQTWVDSTGNHWNFVGSAGEGTFTFATPWPVDQESVFKRMVFSDITEDTFLWRWEFSPDGGEWQVRWAIRYARRG